MALVHTKATPVSDADASPIVVHKTGDGSAGYLREVGGFVTVAAAASIDSTYRLARVPTTAIVKQLFIENEAQAAGAADFGVYYPTTGRTATADLAANAIDQDFFASAVSLAALVTPTDVVNESTTNTLAKRQQPLWQALGLTSDPGGYFDIVATITTAITTGLGRLGVSVHFID